MRFFLGSAVLALSLAGCSGVYFSSDDASRPAVQQISSRETARCRLIDQATTQSKAGDSDIYLAVITQMEALTVERSGNAFAVRSYQVQSGSGPSKATLTAEIYACPKLESAVE
jgi:23S rRNA G2445 N2-methylase RlmL